MACVSTWPVLLALPSRSVALSQQCLMTAYTKVPIQWFDITVRTGRDVNDVALRPCGKCFGYPLYK